MGRQQGRIGIDGRHRFLSSSTERASLGAFAPLLSIGRGGCVSTAAASRPLLVDAVEATVLLRYETTPVLVVVSGDELDETLLWLSIARSGSRIDEAKGRVVS